MLRQLKEKVIDFGVFGAWATLGLAFIISACCAAVILANHSEFDCNLNVVAGMGVFTFLPAIGGLLVLLILKKIRRESLRVPLLLFILAALVQGGIGLDSHFFNEKNSCPDQTSGTDPFDFIESGMTEAEVIHRLGKPQSTHECNWEFISNNNPLCQKSLVYSIFAPLVPDYDVVWIGKDGHVVDKNKYQSP